MTAFWMTRGTRVDTTWQRAPQRQLVVVLSGQVTIKAGDGSMRTAGPGDLILEDDPSGQGHMEIDEDEVWRLLIATPGWEPQAGRSELPRADPRVRSGRPLMNRMYDDNGLSRTEPFDWPGIGPAAPPVEQWPKSEGGFLSRAIYPAEGTDGAWHQGPRRQIAVTVSGSGENETGDGTRTRPQRGDLVLVEDTTGQGHISRGYGDRRLLFVTVADSYLQRNGVPASR
jgi:quercetin dioxygenase-like cupin family protein